MSVLLCICHTSFIATFQWVYCIICSLLLSPVCFICHNVASLIIFLYTILNHELLLLYIVFFQLESKCSPNIENHIQICYLSQMAAFPWISGCFTGGPSCCRSYYLYMQANNRGPPWFFTQTDEACVHTK